MPNFIKEIWEMVKKIIKMIFKIVVIILVLVALLDITHKYTKTTSISGVVIQYLEEATDILKKSKDIENPFKHPVLEREV